jgi:hypothetical protein
MLNLVSSSNSSHSRAAISSVLAFALSDLATGARRFALICSEAQYASVAAPDAYRHEPRVVTLAEWREFESEVALGLEAGPLPTEHIVSRILLNEGQRKATIVEYVSSESLDLDTLSVAVRLDAHLWAVASRPIAPRM